MRNHGSRFECLRMRPHDHIGWVFAGATAFDELAWPFLAEGGASGELLMYIAGSPNPATASRLRDLYGAQAIQVASISEVYGESGVVDAAAQRATFAAALTDALAAGFSGIRVAADNTALVTDEKRLAAWLRWEHVADRFMAENAVTGLCAFDRQLVDVNQLRHLATLHPLSSSAEPEPQFRMFASSGNLWLEGQIDSFAVGELPLALDVLPPRTGVLIDLSAARFVSRAPLAGLRRLADSGVTVTIRGDAAAVESLAGNGLGASENLVLAPVA
ncbi:MAG: MEDS domain-containing protein [Trebonia sp.]